MTKKGPKRTKKYQMGPKGTKGTKRIQKGTKETKGTKRDRKGPKRTKRDQKEPKLCAWTFEIIFVWILLKYGFCKKTLRKDETLTS